MDKLPKYNPLLCNNRNNLVKIVKTDNFEKAFHDFDPKSVSKPNDYMPKFMKLIDLYANILSKSISDHLGLRVSPFIRQNVHRNEKYIKSGHFDLHFIRGGRNFWTRYNGDCIALSNMVIIHNSITANTVIFDSYEFIESQGDAFYDAISRISDSFAEKANLTVDYTYAIYGHSNPMSMGTCPMSYKIYYSPKNNK